MVDPMLKLDTGTLVAGRYQVVRLLGSGAVKEVFLAWDRLAHRQVALCILHPERVKDPSITARFSREARAAAALTSPFTVRVFDVGKLDDGTRYLVTEAVLGRGLDEALVAGAITPQQAVFWALEVLSALSEAHGRGILHRDVKPENVLLARASDDPAGEVARLTDFGLAKILDESLEGSVHLRTAQGVVMGTPEYMAPEQWSGADLDHRADLYAVGVLLYEMLTGTVPFGADSLREICRMHLFDAPPGLPEGLSDAARRLAPVISKALEKKASARFESADAMRDALMAASGWALAPPPTLLSPMDNVGIAAVMRAELVSDGGLGPLQLLSAPTVVLGRTGHVVVRCLPPNPENDRRMRSVSRRHARLWWKGGVGRLSDLDSASGTTVNGHRLDPKGEGVALHHGDEIALGPHVRFVFEQSVTEAGALPAWARLQRVDRHGEGLAHVLVLLEATVGYGDAHAVSLGAQRLGAATLRVRARAGRLVACLDDDDPVDLEDGQRWSIGDTWWTVAVRDDGA